MLGIIDLEIDMLLALLCCIVKRQQETLVEISVQIGLFGRCALVQLEGEHHSNIYLVLKTLGYQIVIDVVDSGLIVVSEFFDRNGSHLSGHALGKWFRQNDGFTLFGLFQVGISILELFFGDSVGGGNRGKSFATLYLILVVAAAHALINERQCRVGDDFNLGTCGVFIRFEAGIGGDNALDRSVVLLGNGVDALTVIQGDIHGV